MRRASGSLFALLICFAFCSCSNFEERWEKGEHFRSGAVWNIGRGSGPGDVLSGIVALAHKIDVQIVAGGIERSEEATRLLAEGCELGQGFLYSRPVETPEAWRGRREEILRHLNETLLPALRRQLAALDERENQAEAGLRSRVMGKAFRSASL